MSTNLNIFIERWSAWSPGLESPEEWQNWASTGQKAEVQNSKPKLAFVPAMLRRRLSTVGRMALKVAYDCGLTEEPVRTIFASRHGEANGTIPILQDIMEKSPVSPAKFSLSVHNSASGIYSISANNRTASTAVAAKLDTFEMGFVEAASALATGRVQKMLVVYSDAPLKPPFDVLVDYEPPFAGAFLLTAKPTPLALQLQMQGKKNEVESLSLSHTFAFMRFLLDEKQQSLAHTTDRLHWVWTR